MAVTTFTLKVDAKLITGETPRVASVLIRTNFSGNGGVVNFAGADGSYVPGGWRPLDVGVGQFPLPHTNVAGAQPESFRYWVWLRVERQAEEPATFGPFEVDAPTGTTMVWLNDCGGRTDVPAEWSDAFRDEMAAFGVSLASQTSAAVVQAQAARTGAEQARDEALTHAATSSSIALGSAEAALVAQIPNQATPIGGALSNAIATAVPAILADDETVVLAASEAVRDAITASVPSTNLYNPADAQVGYTLNTTGGQTASALYTLTGNIPVEPGAQVTVSNCRNYEFRAADASFLDGSFAQNSGSPTKTLTVPAGAGFFRCSFLHDTYGADFRINRGGVLLPWEPYGDVDEINGDFVAAVAAQIPAPQIGHITVTRAGSNVQISSALGGKPLAQSLTLATGRNGRPNLLGVTYDGATIHVQADEITPVRTQMDTVGANHGYPCVSTFTNPDGKTTADLGSVYTDTAGREYVILGFDSGKIVVGGSYVTTGGVVTSAAVNPATNLIHVSGGAHTGTIDRTTRTAAQLAPSVGRSVVTLWCDGLAVADGTTKGSEVVLRETYDILDYASIYDTAKAQPGTAIPERDIDAAVRVTVTWRWTGEGLCRVSTEYVEMKPTTLAACGGLQAGVPQTGATYPTRYLPGVGVVGTNDWTGGVPMSTFTTTQIIPASAGVPAFALDVLPTVAFAMGYLPHGVRGDEASRSSVRATKSSANVWDMRSTRKSYPTVTTAEAAGWGRLVIEGYRAYLTPTQAAQVLAAKGSAAAAYSTLATILGL